MYKYLYMGHYIYMCAMCAGAARGLPIATGAS